MVTEVLAIVATYHTLIERVNIIVAQLDVLSAFAQASSQYNWIKPEISQSSSDDAKDKIMLVDSKHPLIEVQDPNQCISNDCLMVKDQSNM